MEETALPKLSKDAARGKLLRGAGELVMVLLPALLVLLIAEHFRPPVASAEVNGSKPDISLTLAAFGKQLEWLYVWIEILLTAISAIFFNWMVGWIDFHKTADRIRVIDEWIEKVTAYLNKMSGEAALLPAISSTIATSTQSDAKVLAALGTLKKTVEDKSGLAALEKAVENMQQQIARVVTDRKASEAIQALAKDFGCVHPIHLYGSFLSALTKQGHLTVFDLSDVFETDIELIQRLVDDNSGPLISTVLPNDLSLDSDIKISFPPFRKFMNAQVKAAAAGLEVHRLYMISKKDSSDNTLFTHLQELADLIAAHNCQQKFNVYVVDLSVCKLIGDHFDLVAFGDRCISFGRLDRQAMALIGAEYFKVGHGPKEKDQQYEKLKDIISQTREQGTKISGIYKADEYLALMSTHANGAKRL